MFGLIVPKTNTVTGFEPADNSIGPPQGNQTVSSLLIQTWIPVPASSVETQTPDGKSD